jgi:hypothetical protein
MSLPRCQDCNSEVSRTELVICECCQRGFCVLCLPYHAPCSQQLLAEERIGVRESSRS